MQQPSSAENIRPTAAGASRPERLGTAPVGQLLLEYSLPAIVAQVAASLYNIVDRIFIGNGVGPLAIAALAIVMPIMNLTAAFGAMVGAGAASMSSIRLGQQRHKDAADILGNAFVLNCLIGLVVAVTGLVFLDDVLRFFGASQEVLPYARDFMSIILVANFFNHNFLGLNHIMRATGYPRKAMCSTLLTVSVNVVLAPLFIFGFGWGIRGAALATATAQFSGFVWVMCHFCRRTSALHFQRGIFRLRWRVIGDILSIGLSPFLVNVCTCLVVAAFNHSLMHYGGELGDMAVGAYGISYSVVMLFLMTVLGLGHGMQPIVGYNFGARRNDRVMETYRRAVVAATCVTATGFLLGELFPHTIVSAFTSDGQMRELACTCLRIILISFPLVGFQMTTTTFFQAIGKAGWSILLSLSRQLIFLAPALLLLPRWLGLKGVYAAYPTGDILAAILTVIIIVLKIRQYRDIPAEKAAKASALPPEQQDMNSGDLI